MEIEELINRVQQIVVDAKKFKDAHIEYKDIPVNYACIFCQSEDEYQQLNQVTAKMGKVISDTPSGYLFHINPIQTIAGKLQLLKIRKPDPTRTERGDADFSVPNFEKFQKQYLGKPGYKLIQKDNFVMIELYDPAVDVRVYFSNPPLDKQLNLI